MATNVDNNASQFRNVYDVPHVQQSFSWDCGIACVAMILDEANRANLLQNIPYFQANEDHGFGDSTWTIDLCYILAHYKMLPRLYTISIGVNSELESETFYKKAVYRDQKRVTKRFEESREKGVDVVLKSLAVSDIVTLLASGPLIVLVDTNFLKCLDCSVKLFDDCVACWPRYFQGHYIVIISYNEGNNSFYYRNPTYANRLCQMTAEDLDSARFSFGTDEDIIFINQNESTKNKTGECLDNSLQNHQIRI